MILGLFDKPAKEENKGGVVGGRGCGGGRGRKVNRGGGLREGGGIYTLLNIKIIWPFVKLIDELAPLLNYTCVSN